MLVLVCCIENLLTVNGIFEHILSFNICTVMGSHVDLNAYYFVADKQRCSMYMVGYLS